MKIRKRFVFMMLIVAMAIPLCVPVNACGVWGWSGAGNAVPALYTRDTSLLMKRK